MKVKELPKMVNVAWSPASQYPISLAAGTAAQLMDSSFSTNASLDLYSINLHQPGYEMQLQASVPSDQKFHKIIWGSYGNNPAGTIVGGCDNGRIKIYSAAKMLANDPHSLISSPEKHRGPVTAMDFNPFQSNLLATGATESEIYIWDLNNTERPMCPGTKSMPSEDVQSIAWNKQVQHILASTFSQRCVIWDLKKNEAILKLSDANSKVRWKSVQWHPDIATQLCLASEEDQSPIIELWDLRYNTSPLKTFHGHQKGVLSIAWNPHDSDLLLSCAKDNTIICWNPNSAAPNGEIVCNLAQTSQWNFDVSWCPRFPGLLASTSSDGQATVYSLLGGSNKEAFENSNKIADSFPGMDPLAQPPPSAVQSESAAILTKAPKWLKRPVGASFGFGGKLVIFENEPVDPNATEKQYRGKAYVSQVVTNPELVEHSNLLEAALANNLFTEFCKDKINQAQDEHKKKVWSCINAYFGENVTQELLELLGFNVDQITNKLNQFVPQPEVDGLTDGVANKLSMNGNALDGSAAFDAIADQEQRKSVSPNKAAKKTLDSSFKINTSDDVEGLITQAILLGNIEVAVALCFENKKYADAVILAMAGGPDLLAQTQYKYFNEHSGALNSLINSVVSENWIDVVKNCDINCWKEALVGVFTHTNPEERSALCDILGDRLATSENANLRKEAEICYICSGNLNKAIESSDADIQEIVELVTMMQKGLEFYTTRKVNVEGNIATVLTRYAEMLAAEGDLDAALTYLGSSQEPRITMLRDRLYIALGHIQPQRPNVQQNNPYGAQQNMYTQNQSLPRRSIPGGAQSMFTPVQPTPPPPVQSQQPAWNTAPTRQSFSGASNQAYGSVVTHQPYPSNIPSVPNQFTPSIPAPHMPNQTPDPYGQFGQQPLASAVPPPPPAAATSQGSNASGSRPPSVGPHSRSKYLIDPSVKSGPTYGSSGYSQNTQMFNNSMQPQTFPTPGGFPSQAPYQPQQPLGGFGNYGSTPAPNTMYNPAEPELQQQQQQQQRPLQPTLMTPSPMNPQSMYDPTTAVSQQNVPPPPSAGFANHDNSAYQANQPAGWNDPPIAKSAKSQQKSEFQRQDPVMHPLRAGPTATPFQPEPTVYQPDPYHQQGYQQDPQAMYNQYNQNIAVQGMQQFNRPAETLPAVQTAQIVRAPEPEKPKAPIPEEHKQMQSVFNELKDRCSENARNPQIKRKIDDVAKKLEVFYDCLREQKISPNTLQGLHQISEMINVGDYPGGLSVHTQLVSGPDFSLIASFMPGIKVLLQVALQLGVYIR